MPLICREGLSSHGENWLKTEAKEGWIHGCWKSLNDQSKWFHLSGAIFQKHILRMVATC
jgi:hypothetical protein